MIAVVGSLNVDLVVPVPHHPVPGETVLGGAVDRHPGGKGANQAATAARCGGEVAMIGRVGDDADGHLVLEAVAAEGIDTTHVRRTEGSRTGCALITVDSRAENVIVVSPGANRELSLDDISAAAPLLDSAKVVVLQQEVRAEVNRAAVRGARGVVLYNPAPAAAGQDVPDGVDLLVPNRTELAALARTEVPRTLDDVVRAARTLKRHGDLIVTLGADGVLVVDATSHHHVPAFPVAAIDTTAAGDSFCGALAVALSEERDLLSAVRWATAAAALSTTRAGAFPSLPHHVEVDALLAAELRAGLRSTR